MNVTEDSMTRKLEGLVCTALDNAYDGGYREIVAANPRMEAENLMTYDADVEDYCRENVVGVEEIVPYVRAWQKSKQSKESMR